MSSSRSRRRGIYALAVTSLALFSWVMIASLKAQETKPEEKPAATADKAEEKAAEAEAKKDPFAVPAKGDAAAYVDYLDELGDYEPDIETQEEYVAEMIKIHRAMYDAGTKGLAQKPNEEQIIPLLRARVIGMISLYNLGELDSPKDAITTLEPYLKDERPRVSRFANTFLLNVKLALLEEMTDAERKQFVNEVMTPIEKEGLSRANLGTVNQLAQSLEQSAPPEEAVAFYERFAKLAKASDVEPIQELAEKMEGVIRRLKLPGNKMNLFGKTADGKEFDWESYRGKVVLVDFWATWCGPCIAELPNVLENYKKYHDQGFDVVGVNLDEDKERLQAFVKSQELPWVNIFPEKESERGWEHPLARHYGIMGIPATILVDREGKVVSLSARGPELGALLEELLKEKK